MNLRFVEAFLWVARLQSFKAAAEKMHTTQAAISSRIATLEEELGGKLFERDSRGVTLTSRGAGLIPLAEKMLDLAGQMRSAAETREEISGTLRLGAMETVVHTFLPALLSAFALAYPRVTVELHSDITPVLRDELLKGRLDCVLASEEITEGFVENLRLADWPVHWAAAPGLALPVPPGPYAFAALTHLPLLTFHKQSIICKNVIQSAGTQALRLNCLSSLAAMISLAKAGFGIATLPPLTIHPELAAGTLRLLEVTPPLLSLPIVASVQAGRASPLTEDFAQMAYTACEAYMHAHQSYTLPSSKSASKRAASGSAA